MKEAVIVSAVRTAVGPFYATLCIGGGMGTAIVVQRD